jgi:hypothetical protein
MLPRAPHEVAGEALACQRRSTKRRRFLDEQRRLDNPSESNFGDKVLKLEFRGIQVWGSPITVKNYNLRILAGIVGWITLVREGSRKTAS